VKSSINKDIKDQLFNDFLIEWQDKYVKLKEVLTYLETYSETLAQIKDFSLIKVNDLDQEQREWLWLLTRLDNPIDTGFFKPWWILVNSNEYDQFIDLSTPTFELFQVDYFPFQPYQWFKIPLIPDIQQFMLTIDEDKLYMDTVKSNSEQIKLKINGELFVDRIKLGLRGQIDYKISDFCRETIVPDNLETEPVIEITDNSIFISGINAKIAAILPANMDVSLDEITYASESGTNAAEIIENMNALVFLLTKTKKIPVTSFFLIFGNCPDNYAWFRDDTLYISHSDKKVISQSYRNLKWILNETFIEEKK
jgi:hypothetical protein